MSRGLQKIHLYVKMERQVDNIRYEGVTDDGEILFEVFAGYASFHVAQYIALVHAIAYVQEKNYPCEAIYTISKIAIKWVKQKRSSTKAKMNPRAADLLKRADAYLNTHGVTVKVLLKETRANDEDKDYYKDELYYQFKKIIGKY